MALPDDFGLPALWAVRSIVPMSATLDSLVEPLLHSPRLPEIAEALQVRLRDEAARRVRFYADMSDAEKVEFIDGEVVSHPSSTNSELQVRQLVQQLLSIAVDRRDMGAVRGGFCLCVFRRNDYQPDVVFFGRDKAATFTPNTMKFPVPDLAVEVLSMSTESRDRGVKLDDYAAQGVAEYWIVDPDLEVVEQYLARDGQFELKLKSNSGDLTSPTLGGLTLPIKSFFDPQENFAAIQSLVKGRQ
ncbi:MAG: Uma2 family endonuclease [Planctomycetota bacterium]|nr:MAG: Uma2 family endonuclease [Planctomycetota bacterium]